MIGYNRNSNTRKAIWGIGVYGGRLCANLGSDNIDFFIDRNPWRKSYAGHPVLHPNEIDERTWKELFVYVPFNYFEEIKEYLESKGLLEGKDFEKFSSKSYIDVTQADEDMKRYLMDLEKLGNWADKTVVWGRFWQKKEYIDFFSAMRKKGVALALVSEAVWINSEETEEETGMTSVVAPIFADEETLVTIGNQTTIIGERIDDEWRDIFLIEIEHLSAIFDNGSMDSIKYTLSMIIKYIVKTLDYLSIKRIICLDSMLAHHEILYYICKKRGIDVVFSHQGILPGTLSFDSPGEVGESIPSIKGGAFSMLKVSNREINQAKLIIKYLYYSRANRKVQPKTNWLEKTKKRLLYNRPIVLYIGQNDVHSHMVPYSETTRRFYSPVFNSTKEGLILLAEICKNRKWNLIFKPHPMYTDWVKPEELPPNAIYVPFGDINEMIDYCSVMVTILSTSNYISLIRNKPVVMLGYNQTRDKGCTYEAFDVNDIEDEIDKAIKEGFTDEQRNHFVRHIAQCVKYYLYDDLQPREIRYGMKVPKEYEDFFELERLLT